MGEKNTDETDLYKTEIYYTNGTFNEELYNEYVKKHLTTTSNNLINNMLNSYEAEDRYINYISIGLKSDRPCSYSELLLLDLNNNESTYIPVLIININTSSPYALMKSNTDNDSDSNSDSDSNIAKNKMNLYDLKNLIMKNYNSTKIINYVIEKYI